MKQSDIYQESGKRRLGQLKKYRHGIDKFKKNLKMIKALENELSEKEKLFNDLIDECELSDDNGMLTIYNQEHRVFKKLLSSIDELKKEYIVFE